VNYLAEDPWPAASTGNSLTRKASLAFAHFPESWLSASPTPGAFTVSEDYASWAAANGVGTGHLDDDGDSLENFLEYALGTNPTQPNALPPATFDGGTGTVTFPSHLTRPGFELLFETSSDLVEWTVRETTPTDTNGSIQTNSYSFARHENPVLFWRLTALAIDGK
jgi:hypothetical protein